jgi:hypothetical protein
LLNRLECLEILGLGTAANPSEIETRYTMLVKRDRGKSDPETIDRLDKITLAYNILTGRYVEPEPENPLLENIIFGKSRRQWANIWHYGRWKLLAGLAVLAFIIYMVVSIATNKPPDIQIVAAGRFAATQDCPDRVSAYVQDMLPGTERVEFQLLPLDLRDPAATGTEGGSPVDGDSAYGYRIKLVTLLAADSVEIFIMDRAVYDAYAGPGAFVSLDALYQRLADLPPDVLARIQPQRRYPPADSEAATPGATPEATPPPEVANADTSLPISGLDVSALQLGEGLGLYGDTQILAIGARAGDPARTAEFLEAWIRDYQKMQELKEAYEQQMTLSTTASSSQASAATTR